MQEVGFQHGLQGKEVTSVGVYNNFFMSFVVHMHLHLVLYTISTEPYIHYDDSTQFLHRKQSNIHEAP